MEIDDVDNNTAPMRLAKYIIIYKKVDDRRIKNTRIKFRTVEKF